MGAASACTALTGGSPNIPIGSRCSGAANEASITTATPMTIKPSVSIVTGTSRASLASWLNRRLYATFLKAASSSSVKCGPVGACG
jgi:hypothetical protein